MKTDMRQVAPWPSILEGLVKQLRYKQDWTFSLVNMDRGQGSEGLTLCIHVVTPDSYHPETMRATMHLFPVPPAAYDMRSWRRWLFDRIGDVDTHERCEFFQLRDDNLLDPKVDWCIACGHLRTQHDGRDSSCVGCPRTPHRFLIDSKDAVYVRPYAPSHGFGQDPYMIREIGTEIDQRTSFRNKINEVRDNNEVRT